MTFKRPIEQIQQTESFGQSEVGLTHPYTPAFMKLADNGDIEIWAGEGLGMVFHPQNKSITIMADSVKFITKEQDGLRWNKNSFNAEATSYVEPALMPYDNTEIKNIYRDVDDFLEDE